MDEKQKEIQAKITELTWLQARLALRGINEGHPIEEAIEIAVTYDQAPRRRR